MMQLPMDEETRMAHSAFDTVPKTCESEFSPTEDNSNSVSQKFNNPTMNNSAVLPGKVALNNNAAKGEYAGSYCPQCGKERVFPSHRKNFLERFRSRFGRFPFRCHACGYRFFKILRQHRAGE